MPTTRLALAAALLSLLGAGTASAQRVQTGSVGSTGFSPPVHGGGAAAPRRPQEPPGLPGTAAKQGESAAAVQTDLAPTEALFDAINRGDVTEARDAVSRGADINARSALGLTPVDLSVDLSRNDITFLLLSVRAQDGGAAPKNVAAGSAAADTAVNTKATSKLASVRVRKGNRVEASLAGRRPAASGVTPTAPTRYAGGGGAPIPQAGFLGFGGTDQP